MLHEFRETRQVPGDIPRRWFSSEHCDLILWLNEDESLWGFQLCYDKPANEHALTWVHDAGYSHMAVDSGGRGGHGKGTPFLVANGVFDPGHILGVFEMESTSVPDPYRDFIVERIRDLIEARGV